MRNKCLIVCAWVLVAAACVRGGEADDQLVPRADEIDRATLREAARAALVRAVDFIRKQASKDEEGWVVPPVRQRKVVDYKEVTLRYANKTFREPVYEYETYETYERAMGDDSLSSKKLKKVTRKRIKRQIGTKPVVRLVYDPKGPITKTVKRAVWGPGGPDFWGVGRLGHNALALLAMRQAGVGPEDEAVSRLAENLANFVERYGAPDPTWDLACMTAAFATMPDDHYRRLVKPLASKLLDGQITSGKAKGLWGPVCINTRLLAAALKYEQVLSKIREKEKLRVEKRNTLSARKKFDKAEAALLTLQQDILRQIAISSSALTKIDYRIYLTPDDHDPVTLIGLPHYVFTQTTADIESTAVALWALRIAADKGLLPKETYRPTVNKRAILPPEKRDVVLSRAARALASAQHPDGGWDEMNRHQPVRDFDAMTGMPGVPVKPARFPGLASATTCMSTWQGYAALLSAGHAIGLDRLLAQLGTNARRSSARARALAEGLIKASLKPDTLGARVPPYDCYLFLVGVNREFQGAREDRGDLWQRLSYKLLETQNADGSWGRLYPLASLIPTSLRARLDCKDSVMRRTPMAPDRSRAHTLLGWTEKGELGWKYYCYGPRSPLRKSERVSRAGHYTFDKVLHATACAVLFLADGVRQPIAGECVWSDKAGPSGLLTEAVALIRKKCGVSFAFTPVGRDLPPEDVLALPVLLIRGAGAFELGAKAKESLQNYLKNGGLALVAAKTDPAGSRFLKEARPALQELVQGGAVRDISANQDLLGEMAGKVTLNAVTTSKGAPAVVFLPVTAGRRPADAALTASQAAAVVSEFLMRRVPANVTKESYPTALEEPAQPKEGVD